MKADDEPARRRRRRLWLWPWIALASLCLGVLCVWLALYEATWLRPLLQHHVFERSQRHVDFDHLRLGLSKDLEPTVRFRGLRIDNAPWADKRPLVVAGEVRFTFAWRSLAGEHFIVNRLDLIDAQVDLERNAAGLRNWRLTRPDYVGPGRIKVLTLDARNSSLRFVHGGHDLEVDTQIAPLEEPLARPVQGASSTPLPLTKRLSIRGTRGGQRFDAALQVSDVLSFIDSATPFAVRGDASSLRTRLHVDGTVESLAELGAVDAQVTLAGASLAELSALLHTALPASRPFSIDSRVRKTGTRTEFGALAATLGRSDLSGELTHDRTDDDTARRVIDAHLRSKSIDLADLPLSSAHGNDSAFDLAGLKRIDAKLALNVGHLKTPWPPQVKHVRLSGSLAGGVIKVESLRFDGAGGSVVASGSFDVNHAPQRVALKVDLDSIQVDQLLPPQADKDRVVGAIGAHAELQASGANRNELLRSLTGTVTAATSHASISSRLDARLALNGGRLLRTMLEGPEQIPVRCGSVELRMRDGVGRVERLVLETDRLRLVGAGQVDLREQSMAFTLAPRRKQAALFALERTIRIAGPFNAAHVSLDPASPSPPSGSCLAP